MAAENEERCTSCGANEIGRFVQHGSYFSMCMSCKSAGWATSWLAVSGHIEGPLRVYVVNEAFQEQEFLGQGNNAELMSRIGAIAAAGKLVQLKQAKPG